MSSRRRGFADFGPVPAFHRGTLQLIPLALRLRTRALRWHWLSPSFSLRILQDVLFSAQFAGLLLADCWWIRDRLRQIDVLGNVAAHFARITDQHIAIYTLAVWVGFHGLVPICDEFAAFVDSDEQPERHVSVVDPH